MAEEIIKSNESLVEAWALGIKRSPKWETTRLSYLKEHPNCAVCAPGSFTNTNLQVHHIFPFHICADLGRSDLELDERNLIGLCQCEEGHPAENHHLLIGHLDCLQSFNLNAIHDAKIIFNGMSADAIRRNEKWKQKVNTRPKPYTTMSKAEKVALRALIDKTFPKVKLFKWSIPKIQ